MHYTTNVAILIPGRKKYCDYRVDLDDNSNGTTTGQWSVIDFMPAPPREGYTKINLFLESAGDAALDKGLYPGYHLFFFRLGYLASPILIGLGFNAAYVHVKTYIKERMFHPGKESWAKEAQLIPSGEEALAIFWE